MAGKTEEEIVEARDKAHAKLREMGYEFVNTLFTDEWYSDEAMEKRGVVQIPLCYLAKSLENMSLCHAAYFCKGWENARGCRIEHDAAVAYGLEVLYEDSDEQRSKVAEQLRILTSHTHANKDYVLDALGLYPGEYIDGFDPYCVNELTDLIDRPTCHISETDHEFEDSVRCDRCRMTFNRPWEPFKYCPNCGAVIIDAEH